MWADTDARQSEKGHVPVWMHNRWNDHAERLMRTTSRVIGDIWVGTVKLPTTREKKMKNGPESLTETCLKAMTKLQGKKISAQAQLGIDLTFFFDALRCIGSGLLISRYTFTRLLRASSGIAIPVMSRMSRIQRGAMRDG